MKNFRNTSDQVLLAELKTVVQKEKELLLQVLHLLREVEARKLYLARGYSSLFKFCLEFLHYSEAEAMVRIQAMRLLKSLPEVEKQIQSGELSLTNAAQAQNQFRREDSRRKSVSLQPLLCTEKLAVVNAIQSSSTRQCERQLAQHFPEIQVEGLEKSRTLKNDKTLIQFVAGPELMEKLERLKGLLAHKNFSSRYDLLFAELADMALKKLEPEVKNRDFINAPPPRAPKVTSGEAQRSRYIRGQIRRQVRLRAQGSCQYHDPQTGKRCGSQHGLEIDHIQEFSRGGTHELENLQLLCDPHNRLRARQRLGTFASQTSHSSSGG